MGLFSPRGRRPRVRAGIFVCIAAVGLLAWGNPRGEAQRARVLRIGNQLPPPPAGARSVEVRHADAPVFLAPRRGAFRRGTLAYRARFPILRRVAGDGCSTRTWVEIEESVFVCENDIQYVRGEPEASPYPRLPEGRLLPYDYAFVSVDGAPAYADPHDYFADEYYEAMGAGFGVIVTGRRHFEGISFSRTRRGLWIESNVLRHARGSSFRGVEIENAAADTRFGFVRPRHANLFPRARAGRAVAQVGRRQVVRVTGEERRMLALDDGRYIRRRDVALMDRATELPEGVPENGRWLDVDISEQVLVAYEGLSPRFATLVSTGRNRRSHATPLGAHRIWIKLAFSDMDDLERDNVSRNYAIERVPWVQYFEGSNGLHAAFWHDDFGRRKSHGCVNLSPLDARRIYNFTSPIVPDGWSAIFPRPASDEYASIVNVHP